jgi:hypothetical protein
LAAALTFTAAAIVFFAWPRSGGAEDKARQQAQGLACNISQVGLGGRPCAKVENFRKAGPNAWRFRFLAPAPGHAQYRCWELLTKKGGALKDIRFHELPCRSS